MQRPSALSSLIPQKFSLKNMLKKILSTFQETELSYILGSIFRTLIYSEPQAYSENYQNMYNGTHIKNSYLAHWSAQDQKIKKIYLKKLSYTPRKWSFIILMLKKFLILGNGNPEKILYIFSKHSFSIISLNETFLYFRKQKPRKNSYIFSRKRFSYILEKGNLEKILYTSRKRTFLYF